MEKQPEVKQAPKNLNKAAYAVFVLAGIGFLIARDISQGVIFFGLALVFDPFNINQPFQNRPAYQKLWLVAHLLVTLVLFALLIMGK